MPLRRFAVFVEIVCDLVVAALLPDRVLQIEAAMPATCGQAMDVPEIVFVAVLEPIQADMMLLPGAKVSTQVPKLEKLERASVLVLEPTQMPKGADAGEVLQAFALLLPAATTITAPARWAPSTASLDAWLKPPPKDMEPTRAPARWPTQLTPAMTPVVEPDPVRPSTFTATTGERRETPCGLPAAVPAQWVP